MKTYKILSKFVGRQYNIGDTFTEKEFTDKRMLAYYLSRGYVCEITEDMKPKKSRKETTDTGETPCGE
jgi:hypothetical protein